MTTDGGRFDFEDGGAYVGGWSEGKAHGLGLVTGPRGQGEFAGMWEDGFESSGVYIWPSGNAYEGEWRHGKRHGLGVEIKGRWMYRGEWMTGFRGRYGVRESEASGAKYEGTWQLGMQDGAGVETYSDGSTYSGCWFHGTRNGLGIRKSVPFGLAAHYRDGRPLRESLTSLRSQDSSGSADNEAQAVRMADESRGGFVLRGRVVDAGQGQKPRRNSLARSLLGKLKRQRSAGDIADQRSGRFSAGGAGGSVRSAFSVSSRNTDCSSIGTADYYDDIVDPSTTETYYGDWKQDKRSGFGVAERSDGLRYEGEWEANKKHGYGITTFPDGSVEAGKYKQNVLAVSTAKRSKLFLIKSSRLRERVETAVREAQAAKAEALKKGEMAQNRQQTSRQKAELADEIATRARQDAELARKLAKDYAPDFHQPGVDFLKRRAENEIFSTITLTTHHHNNTNTTSLPSNVAKQRQGQEMTNSNQLSPTSNSLHPNQLVDGTLQVGGGGSRRGSFRAVRRNSVDKGSSSDHRQEQRAAAPANQQQAPPALDAQELANKLQITAAAAANQLAPPPSQQQQQQQQQHHYQQQQQHQQQQQLAPANHSQQRQQQLLDRREMAANRKLGPTAAAAAAAPVGQPMHPSGRSSTQYSMNRVEPMTHVMSSGSTADHFDQYSISSRKKRDSGLGGDSSFDDSPNSAAARSANSTADDVTGSLSSCRRRTLPSLLNTSPVAPYGVGQNNEELTVSTEDINKRSTYIIENGIRKRVQASNNAAPASADTAETANLPKHYEIQSQQRLCKDLGIGSIPDTSVCHQIQQNSMMSKAEVSRLSQARRMELKRLEQRRQQGEIVIRLADLKDWCAQHLLLLFVLLVNSGLAVLFVSLVTSGGV